MFSQFINRDNMAFVRLRIQFNDVFIKELSTKYIEVRKLLMFAAIYYIPNICFTLCNQLAIISKHLNKTFTCIFICLSDYSNRLLCFFSITNIELASLIFSRLYRMNMNQILKSNLNTFFYSHLSSDSEEYRIILQKTRTVYQQHNS